MITGKYIPHITSGCVLVKNSNAGFWNNFACPLLWIFSNFMCVEFDRQIYKVEFKSIKQDPFQMLSFGRIRLFLSFILNCSPFNSIVHQCGQVGSLLFLAIGSIRVNGHKTYPSVLDRYRYALVK